MIGSPTGSLENSTCIRKRKTEFWNAGTTASFTAECGNLCQSDTDGLFAAADALGVQSERYPRWAVYCPIVRIVPVWRTVTARVFPGLDYGDRVRCVRQEIQLLSKNLVQQMVTAGLERKKPADLFRGQAIARARISNARIFSQTRQCRHWGFGG